MEALFDFRHLSPDSRRRERAGRVLACFQQALGHELPNQLVAVQGLARTLEMELADRLPEEPRCHLQRLADLTRRVDQCVRTLAQVGRWCRDPEPPVLVDLVELVHEAVAEVNLLSPGWTLNCECEEGLPPLSAPRAALYQVVVQLLRNAARASVPSRRLEVTVRGHSVGDGVEVAVADNGAGIASEMLRTLGEPFSGDRSAGGQGLGLFIAAQMVAGWAGVLRIASEPGQGTTVTFWVPQP